MPVPRLKIGVKTDFIDPALMGCAVDVRYSVIQYINAPKTLFEGKEGEGREGEGREGKGSNVFDENPSDRQKLAVEGSKNPIFGFHS